MMYELKFNDNNCDVWVNFNDHDCDVWQYHLWKRYIAVSLWLKCMEVFLYGITLNEGDTMMTSVLLMTMITIILKIVIIVISTVLLMTVITIINNIYNALDDNDNSNFYNALDDSDNCNVYIALMSVMYGIILKMVSSFMYGRSFMLVIYGDVPIIEMYGHVLVWKFLYDSMAKSLW